MFTDDLTSAKLLKFDKKYFKNSSQSLHVITQNCT